MDNSHLIPSIALVIDLNKSTKSIASPIPKINQLHELKRQVLPDLLSALSPDARAPGSTPLRYGHDH